MFFGPIDKKRWPPWPLIGWDIFDSSSETAELEFNETWQEARSQRPLPSLCFWGRLEKQDGRSGLWLAETFSTSPLKPLNGIQRNLTGSKISTSSSEFVFFGPISKTKMSALGRFLKKVAHCTQVHDMWPFGPLVIVVMMLFGFFFCGCRGFCHRTESDVFLFRKDKSRIWIIFMKQFTTKLIY